MIGKRQIVWMVFLCILMAPGIASAVSYVDSPALGKVISAKMGPVRSAKAVRVPLITWGGDIATILANGNSDKTASGGIFAEKGLSLQLVWEDDFKKQVEAYIKGESPYLRGTMGMINMAAEAVSRDPSTAPVIVYQMTWSNGGDCLVVKSGIKTARDLKGKTIALQAYGPHVDYMAKILNDAGLTMKDVKIKWTPDLTGTENSPAEALYDNNIDAAFVIIPDGLALTSGGTVGTGSEGSVKGAKIMLSTKTANRIIADVYAVRKDWFEANRGEVEKFVHGLMLAEQQLKKLIREKNSFMPEFKKTITSAATILLDSPQAIGDAEALYGDCEFVGFRGNVQFFGDEKWPRNMMRITDEIQSAFVTAGLLGKKVPVEHAMWEYDNFRKGLTGVDDVAAPRFKKEEVAKVVAQKQAMGTLADGELFSLEINFKPNQKSFSEDMYADGFKKIVELASTYGGAVITVEGHSDPNKYAKLKKKGAAPVVLKRTKQAAKNLSMNRALAVRDSIIKYGRKSSVPLDESQFTVIGHGIIQPKFPLPKTKEQWLSNMRVVFRIIQIEAEESVFEPVD